MIRRGLASVNVVSICLFLAHTAYANTDAPNGSALAGEEISVAKEQTARQAGIQAVIYGLPLVMMNLTMQNFANAPPPEVRR
jgi:hypothetical protein